LRMADYYLRIAKRFYWRRVSASKSVAIYTDKLDELTRESNKHQPLVQIIDLDCIWNI
jgi:hypothetical protein